MQIALYDYLEQINQFLKNEQTTEAITHCRYILRQVPRHVDTYRLLARALLENREFKDAAELFRRVLSADPNDFVAHVGLAEIYRDQGELSEAIWHMERAFEMSPYDPVMYDTLRDLYVQRDGGTLSQIPLTRAALARLYFKGELYQEAANELRTILQQNGDDRVDLEILLSETLWRDNQRVDAVAVALKILEKLPDSITVNAILGEVWLLTGRTEEAQRYLQHLLLLTQVDQKHLDLDSVVGQAFQTDGALALPKIILVEQGRSTADADKFDAGTRVGTEQPIEDEAVYDWLREDKGTDMLGALADEEEESEWFTDRLELPSDQEESFAKTAEWLDSLGVEPESGDDFDFVADLPVADEPVTEDKMPPLVDEPLAWPEETADTPEPIETTPESQVLHTAELLSQADEDTLDWLVEEEETTPLIESGELSELAEASLADEPLAGEDEMLPDWLMEIGESLESVDYEKSRPEERIGLFGDEVDSAGTGDLFASDIADEWAEEEDELDFDTADLLAHASDGLPDWLMDEKPQEEKPVSGGFSDVLGTTDLLPDTDLPDWLSDEVVETEHAEPESGLVDQDRLLDSDELFADESPDFTFEEEFEEPESEPSGLTGLLLGTSELNDEEELDKLFGSDDDLPDADEPAEQAGIGGSPGLLGTAEFLADLGSDVPDWLQESEQFDEEPELSSLHTTNLQDENLDEVPHWLFQEEETEEEQPEEELPKRGAHKSGVIDTAELFASLGEDVPDWISETGEEEVDEEEVFAEGQSGLMGTEELLAELDGDLSEWAMDEPDTTGWQPNDADSDEALADDEEDAWLTDEMPMDEAITDIVEEATPPPKSLLDWLPGESASNVEGIFDEADEEEAPDWLFSDTSQDEMEAMIMADNEQENNLEEMPDDSDDMDWLEDLVAQDDAPDTGKRPPAKGEGEMPDWLSGLTEPATDSEAALLEGDDLSLTLTDSDLPDWLKDLGEAAAPARPSITSSTENLPDWLKPPPDLDLGSTEDSDLPEPTERDALAEFAEDMAGEDINDLLDFDETDKSGKDDTSQIWLDALATGDGDFDLELEGFAADEEVLPDWLALPGDDDEALSVPGTTDTDEDEVVLDFMAESVEADIFSLDDLGDAADFDIEAEASDWLAALVADDEGDLSELADDEELPDWLSAAAADGAFDVDDEGVESEDVQGLDLFAEEDSDLFDFEETADDLDAEAVEETPDWLMATAGGATDFDLEETAGDFADDESEELPDWLAASSADDEAEELLPELGLDADDELALDDPMAWLDQLAIEQEEPVEDLPSVLDTSMYDALERDEIADSIEGDQEEEPALSWLGGLDEADEFDDQPAMVAETTDDTLADFEMEVDEPPADELDVTLTELTVTDDEPALDWLDALDESEAVLTEEMETAAPSEYDLETVEIHDDLEETMAWLKELEAEEEEPIEAVPTLAELGLLEEPDAAEDEIEDTADTGEDEFGWLDELAAEEPEVAVAELPTAAEVDEEPEPPDPLQAALDQLEELALQDKASFITADVLDTDESDETESLAEMLDWLEARLDSPAEEATADPSLVEETLELDMEEAGDFEAAVMADELVEADEEDEPALSWLDSLDEDEVDDFDELATLIEGAEVETLVVEPDEMSDDEMTDDLVEETEVEALAVESDEMSDDDIMAFMNAILEDDASFIPEKDVSFTPDDPHAMPSFYVSTPAVEEESVSEAETEDFVDVMADLSPEESEEDVLTGMFDDFSDDMTDDIEAFMNAILDDEESFIPEKDVSFTPDDPNAVPSFATTQMADDAPDEADLGELTDDPDMAIAWLQDLAEAQDETEKAEDLDTILPEIDEDFAVGLFADVTGVEETADSSESIEFDETLADSLPDWLEFDGEERLSGHTDWLRSLPETDVAGWLEAEEEVMASNIFDEIPVPVEPERPSSYSANIEDLATPEPREEELEVESEPGEERSVSTFSLNTGVLNKARQALAKGQYDQAMDRYRSLVEEGQGLSALIADLETATEEHQQPLLRRLLGDAYMRNGQLQRALETYRIALDDL